ncbi:oxidoreductase NAD-binding domain-containing protein 1-like isoform X2 [Tachypleus tridentatus]|uniref:oxidoreductase NAD-binding domain-containing protein 1-like isoform X2 n=1 Tax=Tachypleus tridentatus TaxID=6853 RepID=UPI003FD2AE18
MQARRFTQLTLFCKSSTKFSNTLYTKICCRHIFRSLVTSKKRVEHLTLTAKQFRQMRIFKASVQKIENSSPSVRKILVRIEEPGFEYKAGQWVDFFIPGIEQVAGYSMTSAPSMVQEAGLMELAIRYSDYPPTRWIHKECEPGKEISVRVGGDFFYDPQPDNIEAKCDILLIGGGVGINPVASITQHYCYLKSESSTDPVIQPGKLKLFYSARTEKELIYRDLFRHLQSTHSTISCYFFVTRERDKSHISPDTKGGRITKTHLKSALEDLSSNVVCYVCGPSPMIDDIALQLEELGIKKNRIKYEKWW